MAGWQESERRTFQRSQCPGHVCGPRAGGCRYLSTLPRRPGAMLPENERCNRAEHRLLQKGRIGKCQSANADGVVVWTTLWRYGVIYRSDWSSGCSKPKQQSQN